LATPKIIEDSVEPRRESKGNNPASSRMNGIKEQKYLPSAADLIQDGEE
jgi:hypothetical protein